MPTDAFWKGAHSVSRNPNKPAKREVIGLLGVGLDSQDGEHRITRGEHFLLVGGSQETHERMQETTIKLTEALRRRGKRLRDAQADEVIEWFHENHD